MNQCKVGLFWGLVKSMINNKKWLCHRYLTQVYDEILARQVYTPPAQYGEILFKGGDTLISQLNPTEEDVFIDFGSGRGKFVHQMYLQTEVKAAYGIELIEPLHHQATCALHKIQNELPDFFSSARTLSFFNGDFLQHSFLDATIGLINSICFTPQLLEALGILLNEVPTLRTIASMRPLSVLNQFSFRKCFRLECSWDSTLCYVYERNLPNLG